MSSPPIPPKKATKLISRAGGARRSSTAFSIPGLPNRGNSATPPPPQGSDTTPSNAGSVSDKLDQEGSSTSVTKIDTTLQRSSVFVSSAPSPIPESPAREAAAFSPEPHISHDGKPRELTTARDNSDEPPSGALPIIASLTAEVEQLRRDFAASTSRIAELQQRDEARSTELAAAHRDLEQLRHDLTMSSSHIVESEQRYAAQATALEDAHKDLERLRRESRDLNTVRDELRIFQSQSTEIQQRYDEQLKEIRLAVLERQSQPLAMQRFFAVADTHANKIIIRMLEQLNANVQLIAKNMAECIIKDFEPQAMTMSEEQISAAQRVSEYIGETLTGHLGRNERNSVALHLPIAFQAHLVYLLCRNILSWTTEKRTNDVINEIYERLQRSETQTIAGRWRSLTRTYIVPTHRSDPDPIVRAAVEGLSDIAVVAGCATSVAGARPTVPTVLSKFEDRISIILSTAGTLSKMIGEIISADFNVFAVDPVEKFEGTMMEEDKGQGNPRGTATAQRVLSSTHLGLTKRIRLESGNEDISTVIRAKVVLEPFPDR